MSTAKSLDLLGLPQELAPFEGQIQTRVTRSIRIYENNDFTSGKQVVYYTAEIGPEVTSLFGAYPFNLAAGYIYHGAFSPMGQRPEGYVLFKPSTWVRHEAPSGLAGQNVYYVQSKVTFAHTMQGAVMDFEFEPYETTWQGKAEDMKDPMIRAAYYARVITKGADGKPRVSWTSRNVITPKRRLRRAEVLRLMNMTIDDLMFATRWSYHIAKVSPQTHITSIAMDIEVLPDSQYKSVVYVNGQDVLDFDYRALTNSFGKKYEGFMWMWRLHNGPRIGGTTDNVYGSTLNIPLAPDVDSTITVEPGVSNVYDTIEKTLVYNPNLQEQATLLCYMEFLPANGKNEGTGKTYNLETGEERLF
jgi:hypothetical protein